MELELVLVVDKSSSMRGQGSNMKNVLHSVVAQFELAENATRIGLVEFSHSSRIRVPLGVDRARIENVIDAYRPSGSTAISRGLLDAEQMLLAARPVERVILLFTDGVQSSYYGGDAAAIAAAQRVRASTSATIIAMGFGGARASTIRAIASPPAATNAIIGSTLLDIGPRLTRGRLR
jgi:Mg-chelatase subunit ChlD